MDGAKSTNKMVKHLNTTLPIRLAEYVGGIAGSGDLYVSPDEYIRDLVRRDMERNEELERKEMLGFLASTFEDDEITDWSPDEFDELRKLAYKKQKKK